MVFMSGFFKIIQLRWQGIVSFILLLFLLLPNSDSLKSFGLKGPYTHDRINQEAFLRFTQKTGFEISYVCAEMLNQANFQADVFFPSKPEFHCDNSEFYKCSLQLDKLKRKAFDQFTYTESLQSIGMSMHIVQDFYAHSNWAEITKSSSVIAPIENFKEGFFLLFPNLQSGDHPYSLEGEPIDMVNCYLEEEENWDKRIKAGTHACLEKDSNYSFRGGRIANGPLSFGKTYHEIAGEMAVEHTTKLLIYYYNSKHPHFMSCLSPKIKNLGCHQMIFNKTRGLN
jgi:hypothetical protein